jgi:chemotaxis protein methyltransferase CheR
MSTAIKEAEAGVPAAFEDFRRRAAQLTGLSLTSYKAPQMHRRLLSLMARERIKSFPDYVRVLERDATKRQEFKDFITINVSEFFRDRDRFGDLEQRVLPALLSGGAGLTVWSAGCSFGAEPYSLSIVLQELAPGRRHTILATDVDQTILDRARAGNSFVAADLRNADPERIKRWFVSQTNSQLAVAPAVRSLVRFTAHDLLGDAYPRGPFDLIACRNVVIYFTEAAKERIYDNFVKTLKPNGVLFIGGTEAILRPRDLGLTSIGAGFYQKRAEGAQSL